MANVSKATEPAYKPVVITFSISSGIFFVLFLFYWYFVLCSDGRHLNSREIHNFGIDLENISKKTVDGLNELCDDLMADLKKNSVVKTDRYQKFGSITYQKFYPKYSKNIIDNIDGILADHYKFSKKEKDFIRTFDEKIRMGHLKQR